MGIRDPKFGRRTGNTWPLNIGQVYTTLSRLERDGFVRAEGDDGEGRQHWSITIAGTRALHEWFQNPVPHQDRARDELDLARICRIFA